MKKMVAVCAVWMMVVFAGVVQAQVQEKHHRVVVAMTSGDEADWNLTMRNITNVMEAFPAADVEIVAYGPGIAMVIKPSSADEAMQGLMAKGVKIMACENSMRARKVTREGLVANVGTVPSGVVEVIRKQEDGWSYIKAGR